MFAPSVVILLRNIQNNKRLEVTFPILDNEELKATLESLADENDDNEIEVEHVRKVNGYFPWMDLENDWEDLFGEFPDLMELNEFFEEYFYLSNTEREEFAAFLGVNWVISSTVQRMYRQFEKSDHIFYRNATLEGIAENLVREGSFGEVSDFLINYLDFEAIGSDLEHDGYCETQWGVIKL